MSIKDNSKYKYYINWLNNRLENKSINRGQFELFKISESFFSEFCFRYNNEDRFKLFQQQLYKSNNRDIIIDEIIDD